VGGVFICVKNYDYRELWSDEDFEMIAIEVKDREPKFTWEIADIYKALNDDVRYGKISSLNWLYRKFYKA
jgi:hypothetical protein